MMFLTRNKLRAVAGIGVSLALSLLAACGSSNSTDSGENDTPVTGTSPTPGSGSLNCTVSNGTGSMVAPPNAVSNVSVTCQVAGRGAGPVDPMLPN